MRIVISVFAILFGLLHIAAACFAFSRGKDGPPKAYTIMMLCGGVAVAFAAVAHLTGVNPGWMDGMATAVGCMLACFAAYLNGKWAGNVRMIQHAIRITAASLLAVGFILW